MKINPNLLITNFLEPDKKINSEYGVITNEEWLKKERYRIKKCRIIRDKEGLMALYREEK